MLNKWVVGRRSWPFPNTFSYELELVLEIVLNSVGCCAMQIWGRWVWNRVKRSGDVMKDLFTFSPRLLECSSGRSSLTPSFPIPSESLVAEAVGRQPLCWVQLSFSRRHRSSVTWPQFRAAWVHLPFLGAALASLMPTWGAFSSLSNWVQGRCDHSQWRQRPDLLGIWQQFLCFYKTPQGSKGQP